METRHPEKLNVAVPPSGQRLAVPHVRPRAVFAHDDVERAGNGPAEAARILIVEDDYLVASEMEAALRRRVSRLRAPRLRPKKHCNSRRGSIPRWW